MNTFDPGFQIKESYTWVFSIFQLASSAMILAALVILIYYIFKVWLVWSNLINRHRVTFLSSIFFIFCIVVCKKLISVLTCLSPCVPGRANLL